MYTPSGLSAATAEKLSKKQQEAIKANLPTSEQMFLMDVGGTGGVSNKGLAYKKDDTIYRLGYTPPELTEAQRSKITGGQWQNSTDPAAQYTSWVNRGRQDLADQILEQARWGGKVLGQHIGESTQNIIKELGLSGLKEPNLADISNQGYKMEWIKDPEEFKKMIQGSSIYGGATQEVPDVTSEQKTGMEANKMSAQQALGIAGGMTPDQVLEWRKSQEGQAETARLQALSSEITPQPQEVIESSGEKLSKEQELDIARQRVAEGTATDTDRANIAYAEKTGLTKPEETIGKTKEQTITDLQEKVDSGQELTETDKANWKYSTDKPLPTKILEKEQKSSGIFDSEGNASASNVLDTLGLGSTYSEESIIQSVLDSPEYKLLADKLDLQSMSAEAQAEATKDYLDTKFEQDKSTLEDNLAAKGLAFSGIRASQVRDLATSLSSSKLDIDRDLASKLMDMDLDFKEDVMSFITDKIEEAQAGEKEAIAQLNKAGLAVVGDTLMPTMEAQKEEQQSIMDNANLAIKQAQLELDVAQKEFDQAKTKIQLEQAQQKIDLAIDKYNLSVQKENRLKGVSETGSEDFWSFIKSSIASLQKGESWGIVWNRVKMKFPNASDEMIDTALGGGVEKIQPVDAAGFPISSAYGGETESWGWARPGAYEEWKGKQYKPEDEEGLTDEQKIWQWLATEESKNLSNEEKREQIMEAGYNPYDFYL